MNGLLNVLKPPGMTSHDVVNVVRRLVPGKVGHTGTLDPLASGVLVLTIGAATRLTDLVAIEDKAYRGELTFGFETDTLDLDGVVTARGETSHLTEAAVRDAMAGMVGVLELPPPMYSAVKQGGRRLYELARAGREAVRQPRPMTVRRMELIDYSPGDEPRCLCDIECSKGTYVRSLAQELARRLGTVATLSFLVRVAHGGYLLPDAMTLEEVTQAAAEGTLHAKMVPMARALPEFPKVSLDRAAAVQMQHGGALCHDIDLPAGTLVMVLSGEEAVCIAEVLSGENGPRLQPRRVFRS